MQADIENLSMEEGRLDEQIRFLQELLLYQLYKFLLVRFEHANSSYLLACSREMQETLRELSEDENNQK